MPISHFYNYYIVGSACLLSCMFAKLAMISNKRTKKKKHVLSSCF